jgi:hypothetical protein
MSPAPAPRPPIASDSDYVAQAAERSRHDVTNKCQLSGNIYIYMTIMSAHVLRLSEAVSTLRALSVYNDYKIQLHDHFIYKKRYTSRNKSFDQRFR